MAGPCSAAPCGSDGARIPCVIGGLPAGEAASAMTLACTNAATRMTARYPVREHSRRRPIRPGKFRNPSSVTSPQAAHVRGWSFG
jgi:hypothetical protein